MKRFVIGALCAAALSLSSGAYAEDVVLRHSILLPPTHFLNKDVFFPYFEEIEKVTEGRVKVEVSSAPLGPPPRNYQLAVDGIADITWGVHGYTPGTFPLSELVELPFQSTNAERDSVAYWKMFADVLEPAGMHPGVHTMVVFVQPAGQYYNNIRPIKEPGDFAGLKIRATNSSVSDAIARLGGTPISLPVTEMREALEKGIVDGITLTDEALFLFQVQDFVKYEMAVPGGLYNASFFMVMNEDAWNRISPEDQEAISAISGEALARKIGHVWQANQDAAVSRAKEQGIEISVPEGVLLDYLHEKLDGFEAAWIEKASAAGIDGAAALKAYREMTGAMVK